MLDTELYRHLLGIESPWKVTKVVLSVSILNTLGPRFLTRMPPGVAPA